jgi:flagellar hook-associated protein 3 FlgL
VDGGSSAGTPTEARCGVRVTNQVLINQALAGTSRILKEMEIQQRAIYTGLRVERPSDDPAGVGEILRSSSSLRSLEQYQRNLSTVRSRLSMEDGVLDNVGEVLSRARELAMSQAGSTATAQTRSVALQEVEGMLGFVRELGNTRFSGTYLFGGDYADVRPFPESGPDPARPPSGTLFVEGGSGARYAANHSGQEIFLDTGVLQALEDLATALGANSPADIQAAMGELTTAFDKVQELVGDLGARMVQVEMASNNMEALALNLQLFRSELQDSDLAEAMTKLTSRQVTYEAAMLANARILNATLTHYLR